MSNQYKEELLALEQKLKKAYEEFKRIYRENYDNKELTNEEVFNHVIDEDKIFNNELDAIKLKTIAIMNQIHKEHDEQAYKEVLARLHQ